MFISKGKKKHIIAQRYLCTKNKFGFTVAEKEHYYLENEPRERAEIMGAAGTGRGKTRWMAQRRQNSLGHRQNLLARGHGVTFTDILQ